MPDETNERVIALSIRTVKLTAIELQRAIRFFLTHQNSKTSKQRIPHGRQTIKQLMKQNSGISSIEITDQNIKAFERTAKKYGLDFALKKDKSLSPPRYLVFFKGRDTDVMQQAFKEFSSKVIRKKEPTSIRKYLVSLKALTSGKQVQKHKNKNRGMER